ncbi:MAG: hypothetical protein HY698_11140 [Deltaproteobacteria bacterium]|nr:hypothetical protein [Deltaproteobacteria bacterium]
MRIGITIVLALALAPGTARAGLYWNQGVRTKVISVCFVGDALTSRPDRVQEILDYIDEFENAANLRWNYLGTCPSSRVQANGNDYYVGDIRVVIPSTSVNGTGQVPGRGCGMFLDGMGNYNGGNDGWGSWSQAPNDLESNRSCLYNLKLGDDPWSSTRPPYLNHTLHEFGHALGLAHEHNRADANAGCTESGYGGSATSYLTPYDRSSVMHYKYSSCGINGNYDDTGLSAYDRLSLRILYPEDDRAAEYTGTTVVRTTDTLSLMSGLQAAGANIGYVASGFQWRLNGVLYSTSSTLNTSLASGNYQLQISHRDFLGRTFSGEAMVRVLTPQAFDQSIAAPIAATLPLL